MATRVLITGGSGFIGSQLCRRLVADGAEVHATSRREPGQRGDCGVRWHQLDPADADATQATIASVRPELVYHLSSCVDSSRGTDLVLPTLHANLVSTANVLLAVERASCQRVILPASLEEPDPTEASARVPQSPYAAAKWAASSYARMFAGLYGTPAVLLRLFMVYGPEQLDHTKLIPSVIRSILRAEPAAVTIGVRRMDWVYVDDVVDALVAAAAAPGIEGQTIEIGSGELHSIREVVETLVRLGASDQEPRFGAVPERLDEVERVADISSASELLDWEPTVGLEDGLRRTLEWFEAQTRLAPWASPLRR